MFRVYDDSLRDLLRCVRRRMLIAYCVRAAIVATLAAAVTTAITLLPPFRGFAVFAVSTAAAATLVVRLVIPRRPGLAAVAEHIDREANLHELFASAFSTTDADDPASRSLRAMAADRATSLRASDIRVDFPSPRIAIAAGLMLGATLISHLLVEAKPAASEATIAERDAARTMPRTAAEAPSNDIVVSNAPQPPQQVERDNASTDASTLANATSPTRPMNVKRESSMRSDHGTAAGMTNDAANASLKFDAIRAKPPELAADSITGSSGEEATSASNTKSDLSPGLVDRRATSVRSPSMSDAPNADSSISAAPANAAVPARCRDLVRAYFDASESK